MNSPVYKNKPIGSIDALAKTLSIDSKDLLKLEKEVDNYYFPNKPIIKPNGKTRQTYRVAPYLKRIHKRIIQQIFYNVDYPLYLQGAIKDKNSPRDYIQNASLHAGRQIIICEDIDNFFPSIKFDVVLKMWQHFFHFPKDVANLLALLTTYNGFVPQGASSSPYIANLVLWNEEPQLEYELQQLGFYYSRFVDDITISADKFVSKKKKRFITAKVYMMLKSIGVKPNRSKRKIQTRAKEMTVHNLNINSGKPTLGKQVQKKIRAAVKQCEEMAKVDCSSEEYKQFYQSVNGRVAIMYRLHQNKAEKYRKRLQAIKPTPKN